jgi:antitoxin MazE
MEAKVVRWGDDLVVRLTHSEAEELGVREGETVEIVSKREVVSTPKQWTGRRHADGSPAYTLEEMVEEMRRLGPDFEFPTVEWGPDVGSEIIDDDYSR